MFPVVAPKTGMQGASSTCSWVTQYAQVSSWSLQLTTPSMAIITSTQSRVLGKHVDVPFSLGLWCTLEPCVLVIIAIDGVVSCRDQELACAYCVTQEHIELAPCMPIFGATTGNTIFLLPRVWCQRELASAFYRSRVGLGSFGIGRLWAARGMGSYIIFARVVLGIVSCFFPHILLGSILPASDALPLVSPIYEEALLPAEFWRSCLHRQLHRQRRELARLCGFSSRFSRVVRSCASLRLPGVTPS